MRGTEINMARNTGFREGKNKKNKSQKLRLERKTVLHRLCGA
jgi:hypothetical protein